MKTFSTIFAAIFILCLAFLSSCNKPDETGPIIYLLGVNNQILESNQTDTILLLYTKYVDPGVLVEDNVSDIEDVIVTDDSEDVLSVTSDGYLKKVEDVKITYKAIDEAQNESSIEKNISIKNISEPFAETYITNRSSMYLPAIASYNSIVAVDSRIPGRISFPKVYNHEESSQNIYFRIVADLYSPDLSTQYSSAIAYMGTAADKETPYFLDMSYEEGINSALDFEYLMISAQPFTDNLGNQYTISGVSDPTNNDLPYSRIEYLDNSNTIKRIVLELNVTKDGEYTDRVTEIYTPL
ncbi:MAG: hypothetical protein PHH30_05965 [Bacteroidales bacterium]|nr:hypothetical protein [Bacteroidales bacterium]MDD3858862.1 hypothetical protein [Bacteroidales bacterium]